MIPSEALKDLAQLSGVSDAELEVLSLAVDGRSTEEIALELEINSAAVRKRLGEVYKKFEISGSGPGKLAKLQQILMTQYRLMGQAPQTESEASLTPKQAVSAVQAWQQDWGDTVEVDFFYGRQEELTKAEKWILADRYRLIALIGLSGMGKTTLAKKLVQQIEGQFDVVIWRSLQTAPPFQAMLLDLIQVLAQDQSIELPLEQADQIALLITYLTRHRCLLVIDELEAILRQDALAGRYRPGYEAYGELLKQIGRQSHQSCLLITSSERPKEFSSLEGRKVRAFQLRGLKQAEGQEFFKRKGIIPESEAEWQAIVERYGGNPLALKIVSLTIQELFGSISAFLQQGTTVFGDIRALLKQQFDRLSGLEKEIMYWLAINRDPVSIQELREDIVPLVSQPKLLEALESLGQRALVERSQANFSLQFVVMEYVTEQFIERVCQEIKTSALSLFNSHALIKAHTKDYIRDTQIHQILQPLKDKLLAVFETEAALHEQLMQLVSLQQASPLKPGYLAGNVLNLLGQLHVDLSQHDFSQLTVCQAYLPNMELHQVNFAGADLAKSVFAETLGSILSVAFSPDGKSLATGDTDYKIRLWDVATGAQIAIWQGHEDWIRAIAISPDGRWLASGSEDQTVRLWDIQTGQCQTTLQGHESWVRAVTFSPDGKLLASSSDDHAIRIWTVATGDCRAVLKQHKGPVRSVTFSPNGQTLASGSSDRTVRLWDMTRLDSPTEGCFNVLQGHSRGVRSVAFTPDGQTLASGSSDQAVRLWDVQTGKCLEVLSGHRGWIWSVVFSPDGQTLASSSEDQTIKLWDWKTGDSQTLYGHTGWVRSVAFSPDGQLLASGSDDQKIKLWDVQAGQRLKTLQGYARGVRSVAFSPDNALLASGSDDRTVRVWSLATQQCLLTMQEHASQVWSVAFSLEGNILASGSEDQTVKLWDAQTGTCLKTLQGHQDGVHSVAFSPDGQMIASASADRTIRLWNLVTGEYIASFIGHTQWVWSVAFSPDGQTLASGSGDLTVKLWDVSTQQCLSTLEGHSHWIRSVAFSPDGQTIASSSVGRTVRLWDVKTGVFLSALKGYSNGVRSVAFSPDSKTLASGSDDQVVRIWDIGSGSCLAALYGHMSRVRSVAFSPDSKTLASGSSDEAIKLWDVNSGEEIQTLKIDRPYQSMNITGAINLTPAQRTTLIALGAFDSQLPDRVDVRRAR